jgi:hypothetical protein
MRKWNMIKRFALVGTFTLVLAAVALPASAQTHVSIGIGAPFYPPVAVVAAAPYPGYVWQPAHSVWTAFGYQLVPGAWVPAPYYAPYYSPYYAPYYSPYYAPRGLSLGFGFNVGHGRGFNVGHGHGFNVVRGRGLNVGHGGHHGRHR